MVGKMGESMYCTGMERREALIDERERKFSFLTFIASFLDSSLQQNWINFKLNLVYFNLHLITLRTCT